MQYQFMKTIYMKCGFSDNIYMDTKVFDGEVNVLIQKINIPSFLEKMGIGMITNRTYRTVLRNLKNIKKYCINDRGNFKERNDKDVKKIFGVETLTPVNLRYCIFTYFLITETRLFQDNIEECISCAKLYKDIMMSAGYTYEQDVYPYMEDYIRAYVLRTNQGLDIYQGLLADWDKYSDLIKEDLDNDLILPYIDENRQLTFEQWQDIIDSGLEQADNEKRTRNSMILMQRKMEDFICDESKRGKKEIRLVFSSDIIHSVRNTEKRRTWYMFRMLSVIIEHQIDMVVESLEDYRADQLGANEAVKAAIDACWLEKGKEEGIDNVYATWSQIGQNLNIVEEVPIEKIEKALRMSRINIAKMGSDYDYYFDGVYTDFDEKEEKRKKRNKGYAFATYKMRRGLYDETDEDVAIQERTAERGLKGILSGRGGVSREMLLLTVLISLASGVKIAKNYVTNHVLFNSRFSRVYDKYSAFDNYFCETFDALYDTFDSASNSFAIEILKKRSGLLEEEYIYEPMYTLDSLEEKKKDETGIAIFHDILFGKKVM